MATRFLYLTDTHWGALPGAGWTMQPRDPAHFDPLWAALRRWLSANPVDFILHGGDAVEHGTADEIVDALRRLNGLGAPTYLCLGNHDLWQPTSFADWRRLQRDVWPGDEPTFVVRTTDFDLLVLAHHWNATQPPHYWDATAHRPVLDGEQRELLERHLHSAIRPVVLAMHGPPVGVPAEQCGRAEEAHAPDPQWRQFISDLVDRHPALRLVLAGHNHTHTLHQRGRCVLMTTASFTESPFEARLITIDRHGLEIQTLRFADLAGIAGAYNAEQAWVNGGEAQRTHRAKW